jgi:hypothetical protein
VNDTQRDYSKRLTGHKLIIGYLILAFGFMLGIVRVETLANRDRLIIERIEIEAVVRAHENCVASNETRQTIRFVLGRTFAPRGFSEEEDAVREELLEEFEPLLQLRDCPPLPPGSWTRDD